MLASIKEKKKNRFLFLERIYKIANGSKDTVFDMHEVGLEIGFQYEEISQIVEYLINEHLITPYGLGGTICLTHLGIKEIEEAFDKPNDPTTHFIPINQITIGTMNNSSIQQATHNSTISHYLGPEEKGNLDAVIIAIEELHKTLLLPSETQEELNCEIQTLKSQQKSPKPKRAIIRESLKTIRSLAEGIVGNALAPSVISQIEKFIHNL